MPSAGQNHGSKMLSRISPRIAFLFITVCCAALLGFALYNQYVDYLDPCPLCIFQRVVFFWMGVFALLALVHNPGRFGRRIYTWLIVFGSIVGGSIAGRHIWLQNLPESEVPECGPGLNYMLENFPIMEVFSTVLQGSGSCAEVKWTFIGLSMPMWTLFWYIALGVMTLWVGYRSFASDT
jgi:disulfide bond formation protein DsbB